MLTRHKACWMRWSAATWVHAVGNVVGTFSGCVVQVYGEHLQTSVVCVQGMPCAHANIFEWGLMFVERLGGCLQLVSALVQESSRTCLLQHGSDALTRVTLMMTMQRLHFLQLLGIPKRSKGH